MMKANKAIGNIELYSLEYIIISLYLEKSFISSLVSEIEKITNNIVSTVGVYYKQEKNLPVFNACILR